MIKTLCMSAFFLLTSFSNILMAEVEYIIKDIDTLQTQSSQAIAINNQGQVLGWFNVDGASDSEHFFIRDKNGGFHEIPNKTPDYKLAINWCHLNDDGKVYGTFLVNSNTTAFCSWDKYNGFIKLGILPVGEISAINDVGQVLIKYKIESENGRNIYNPITWYNGIVTALHGLEGDQGIESEESYGFDINNKGDVVGLSMVSLIYKNEIYKRQHAALWTSKQAIDLHQHVLKATSSYAFAINNEGDVLVKNSLDCIFLINNDGTSIKLPNDIKKINKNYVYNNRYIFNKKNDCSMTIHNLNEKIISDINSIWYNISKIISVNDSGEVIAQGETIYGESHAMLLVPENKTE